MEHRTAVGTHKGKTSPPWKKDKNHDYVDEYRMNEPLEAGKETRENTKKIRDIRSVDKEKRKTRLMNFFVKTKK